MVKTSPKLLSRLLLLTMEAHLQSIGVRVFGDFEGGLIDMNPKTPKDWRELCKRAAEEMDPDRLMDLVIEINEALDDRMKKRKGIVENVTDTESEAESQQPETTCLSSGLPRLSLAHLGSLHLARS